MQLQANREVLQAFLPHLDTAGMAESLVRLVGADEQITLNAQPEVLAWIAETDILSRLLDRSRLPMFRHCTVTTACSGTFSLKSKTSQHRSAWPHGCASLPALLPWSLQRDGRGACSSRGHCRLTLALPVSSACSPSRRMLECTDAAGWMRMLQRGSMGIVRKCWRPSRGAVPHR